MAATGLTIVAPATMALEAARPAEARGLRRDQVRLMVSDVGRGHIHHARFADLPHWISPGDVLVVNTSATLNAALEARAPDGVRFEIHLSTLLPGTSYDANDRVTSGVTSGGTVTASASHWIVEVRRPGGAASQPFREGRVGMTFELAAGGTLVLEAPYPLPAGASGSRLWAATLWLPVSWRAYLETHGFPIRYGYVPMRWPLSMYQTVFAREAGSAEMPSAGRPFTPALVTRLVAHGVLLAPVLLHTGVSSLEDHEPPYEEFYRVPAATADVVNLARSRGRRVIAVGTTVVRALETATGADRITRTGEGWTSLVIDPNYSLRAVDALVTGLHEPEASHLMLLERVTRDPSHLPRAYDEARRTGYLWHEFGDAHLILGVRS